MLFASRHIVILLGVSYPLRIGFEAEECMNILLESRALPLSRSGSEPLSRNARNLRPERSKPLTGENFSSEKFESSGRSPVVAHFRRFSKLCFPSFSGWNRCRRDFASGNQLMQLDHSRSTVCTIRFRAFAIGLAFRYCRAVHFFFL